MMFALPRLTTLLALLLAGVLVMTQTFGMVHGITHGPKSPALHSQHHDLCHDHDHHHAAADVADKSHFLAALFSTHQEDSDCRLYDQASHDGALVIAVQLTLPVVPPSLTVAIFQGEALARWAALFDARGPPLTV